MDYLTQRIRFLFEQIELYQKKKKGDQVLCRLVSGDLIEILVYDPKNALRIALILKAGIKSFSLTEKATHDTAIEKYRKFFETYGIRIAIGIGEMDLDFIDKGIFKGEAINRSGRLISEQKTSNKERVVIKNTLFFDSVQEKHNLPFQALLPLLDVVFSKMTPKQCEIILWKLLDYSEQDIAEQLKISQSSVNQRSKGAGWSAIEGALHFYSSYEFQNLN